MQHKIHKLDDNIINKIAAGEVVERPASVVKELIENSIDAGSSRIVISIRDGGKKLIQVVDNGRGIAPDQLKLAVARHATSKITDFDDLYRLKTKGFRGEALASISAVAKMTISSKTKDQEASEIIIEGGEFVDQRACAQPDGTSIQVKYLFYQTPARLKFLKTTATETSHITDVVTKMALSHPEIAFTLLQNDRTMLEVKASQGLKERCVSLLGRDVGEYLYDFSAEVPGMMMHGYLGHPQIARSQRSQTYFFVNGRAVNDKVLWHAVMEAYRDLLMGGKYPVLVLNLMLDENTLDVNVHPQKSEIRFHKSQEVHHFVYQTIRQRLKEAPWMEEGAGRRQKAEGRRDLVLDSKHEHWNSGSDVKDKVRQSVEGWSNRFFEQGTGKELEKDFKQEQKNIRFGRTAYGEMNPIGQLLGTYLLCESGDELVLIDQHAAHERVGFEKLIKEYEKGQIPSQPLLIPETFDLKPSDTDIMKGYLDDFKGFGFEIDFFGGNTFVVKAVPGLLEGKIDLPRFVADLIEDLKATGELVSLKDKLHKVLATMACHAQIRAHHHLSLAEISALLKELDEWQFTDFCPHGRPVCVKVTLDEIEKWFKRSV